MNKNENIDEQNNHPPQDEAMERANQTFNKIKQEVQEMIHGNEEADKIE